MASSRLTSSASPSGRSHEQELVAPAGRDSLCRGDHRSGRDGGALVNKMQLAKAVRDVAADLELSKSSPDTIGAFQYLADLIEAIDDEAPSPEVECETPAAEAVPVANGVVATAPPLTFRRSIMSSREVFTVFDGEQRVGVIERVAGTHGWKALSVGPVLSRFTTRREAGKREYFHWKQGNRP